MKINVSALRTDPGAQENFKFYLEELPKTDNISFMEPVLVEGKIVNIGNVLELAVQVRSKVLTICYRCLDEVEYPLEFSFIEKYSVKDETEDTDDYEETQHIVYEGDWIDVSQAVQENILLNLPMRALCRPDCPGLCPQCGKNLKDGPCQCDNREIDPRLSILAKLKKGDNKS